MGYSYLGGYGTAPSMAKAAEWFEKATLNGNADAPYALADLVYFGHVKPASYQDERELFRLAAVRTFELYKTDLLDTQRKMQLEYDRWPVPRYAASLMGPGMTDQDRATALQFAMGFQNAILERKIIPRAYKVDQLKKKLGISVDWAPERAVRSLACLAGRNDGISYSDVAAAIESYGVKVEDAFTLACPELRSGLGRLMAPAALPLHQRLLYQLSPDGVGMASYARLHDATSLAMYMVWSRGNHQGMNKIYRAKSTDGLTIGELLADRYIKAINVAADEEVQFRRIYNALPRDIRGQIPITHTTLGTLDIDFPVALANAETEGFKSCVKRGVNYAKKLQLSSQLEAVRASPPQGMFDPTSDLEDCVREPGYIEKLTRLEPYYRAYSQLSGKKLDYRLTSQIIGMGNMLRDLCEYEMIHNSRPEYCRIGHADLLNRVQYWTDNLRSGYENVSVDEILRTSMR